MQTIATSIILSATTFFGALCVATPQVYAQGGVPLWTNRYSQSGSGGGEGHAVAVDNSGNVFVTGASYANSFYDYATIKYSSAGVPLWTNRYYGSSFADDQAMALAVDSYGNVVVTGYSAGSGSGYDYATIKYSAAGVPLWINRYGGPGSNDDRAYAVAIDSDGEVFVTGTSGIVAYSNAGQPLWTNVSGVTGSAVALDSSGNVFVTGAGGGDYATVAYSNWGAPLWTNRYNGTGNSDDYATALVVDSSGSVFVTGLSAGNGSGHDYATIKYSNAGLPLWTNRYNGPGNDDDFALALAVDSSGNVFVTGRSTGSGSGYDYATIKYSAAGLPLWTNRYNGTANGYDSASALALDSSGNVFLTGYSESTGSGLDLVTVAYSNAGTPLWTNRYNASLQSLALTPDVAVDASGNVLVTGFTRNGGWEDYVTIKYSSSVRAYLASRLVNNQLVLSWTNPGFGLQTSPTLAGTFTDIPGAASPYTNSTTAPQCYFRLKAD